MKSTYFSGVDRFILLLSQAFKPPRNGLFGRWRYKRPQSEIIQNVMIVHFTFISSFLLLILLKYILGVDRFLEFRFLIVLLFIPIYLLASRVIRKRYPRSYIQDIIFDFDGDKKVIKYGHLLLFKFIYWTIPVSLIFVLIYL